MLLIPCCVFQRNHHGLAGPVDWMRHDGLVYPAEKHLSPVFPPTGQVSGAGTRYPDACLRVPLRWGQGREVYISNVINETGPIVRINPRELHIKDPYYFDTIYQTKRQEKDPYMVRILTIPLSSAAAVDHDRHRFLRQLVNPLFSKRAVASLEHIIQDKVGKVAGRLTQAARQVGTVVSLDGLFAALTAGAISHYTFGGSMGILDTPDLRNDFRDAVTGAGVLCHFSRFFGVLQMLLNMVPGWIEWAATERERLV